MSRRRTEERIRRKFEAFPPAFDAWPSYTVFRPNGATRAADAGGGAREQR